MLNRRVISSFSLFPARPLSLPRASPVHLFRCPPADAHTPFVFKLPLSPPSSLSIPISATAHLSAMDHRSNGHDVEFTAGYDALPSAGEDEMEIIGRPPRWNCRLLAFAISAVVLLALGAMLTGLDSPAPPPQTLGVPAARVYPRGVREGVSAKSRGPFRGAASDAFPWSNEMLQWQRSAFHFQPEKNWMNDPNGPLFFKGWYHLFYQYNPDSAVWGNITWGHAVSRDLIHWLHLPLAMLPDQWYDANGVWTGSATILADGRLLMLYTGSTNASVQVQNLAYPADQSDPLLLNWVKSPSNPVLVPPPGIGDLDFRDPTTAWFVPSRSTWQIAIGSKDDSKDHTGITLIFETKDFLKFDLLPGVLHAVPKTGMWECVDFYPVSTDGDIGLDTSRNGPGIKHVLKASMDDDRHDYYAIGTFDVDRGKWTPDNPELDVGIGLRYDYGVFYASKTFYDQEKRRRVLWGWIGESDSEGSDIAKGWASLQGIPRTVRLDDKTGSNLVQWPVEEVESLRGKGKHFANITLGGGSVVPLDVEEATQLDITIDFEIERDASEGGVLESEEGFTCGTSGGSARRGALGPFGLLVLASEDLSERTAVYFYVAKKKGGELSTFICHDELRSSRANDLIEGVFGSSVPVLDGEKLSLRILVDHSIVETFAQGGRTCITSRLYPTKAIYNATRLFLFNNATGSVVTATSVEVWEMQSASIRPYPGL